MSSISPLSQTFLLSLYYQDYWLKAELTWIPIYKSSNITEVNKHKCILSGEETWGWSPSRAAPCQTEVISLWVGLKKIDIVWIEIVIKEERSPSVRCHHTIYPQELKSQLNSSEDKGLYLPTVRRRSPWTTHPQNVNFYSFLLSNT